VGRYRKKQTEIEAVQLRWTQWNEVCELLGDALTAENPDGAWEIPAEEAADTCGEPGPNYIALNVRTIGGHKVTVRHGDWLIPEKRPGRFCVVEPRLFAATYEAVTG
jgi:hypothetical protein